MNNPTTTQSPVDTQTALDMSLDAILAQVDEKAIFVSNYDPTSHIVCFKTKNNTLTSESLDKLFKARNINFLESSWESPLNVDGHKVWLGSKASLSKDGKLIFKNLCITIEKY